MSAPEGPHSRPNDLARILPAPTSEAAGGGLVIAILGPTGVGKTEVASRVALEVGVRVISCDSMQIYRGFPVLTNQPGSGGAAGSVRHELVAVAEPQEEWSAAAYARRARALIDEDIAATGWAVISGGTGLYMRAALAPLAMARPCDPERRATLERLAASEGPERMHERLAAAAPEVAEKIHPHNVRRVVRALEVIEAGGAEGWSERRDLWRPEYRHPTLVVVLAVDRTVLYERIERRAREMVRSGAVEEVERHRALQSRAGAPPPSGSGGPAEVASTLGAPASPPRGVERAIGYRELAAYLDGRISRDEAIASLAAATRRYARRQVTWVRKLGDADIIDTSERSPQETSAEVLQEAYALRRIPPTEPDVG